MTSPLVNFLGAVLYCQYFMLDIVNCTGHCREGKKRDSPYIANFFLPIIKDLDKSNPKGKSNVGIVELVMFDGATNVHSSPKIMAMRYPLITVLHGTEHVVSLIFKDFYEKIP